MTHYTANSQWSSSKVRQHYPYNLTSQSLSKRGKELCINSLTNNQNPRKSPKSSQNLANSNKREQFKAIHYSEF